MITFRNDTQSPSYYCFGRYLRGGLHKQIMMAVISSNNYEFIARVRRRFKLNIPQLLELLLDCKPAVFVPLARKYGKPKQIIKSDLLSVGLDIDTDDI